MNWETPQLGTLCSLVNGKAYKASDWSTEGLPIIRIQNLNDPLKPFNHWPNGIEGQVEVNHGDVLLAWSGTPGTSFGAHFWRGDRGVLNQHIFRVELDSTRISKRWAILAINRQLDHLIDQAHGGVGLKHVTRGVVESLQIPLPPLPEQRRIAAILDQADATRRKRQKAIELTEKFLKSAFLEMFGDPVTNPKGWDVLSFSDVSDSRLGKMLDAKKQTGEDNRPYMRNINVQWGKLDLTNVWEMDFNEKDRIEFRLVSGDVLICEGGAGVAQTAIWRGEIEECYFQKSLHRVRPKDGVITSEYVAYLIWMLMREGTELHKLVSSATIPHLTGVKLKTLPIPIPPFELQQRFSRIYLYRENLMKEVKRSAFEVTRLFNSLVQRAFRGELSPVEVP